MNPREAKLSRNLLDTTNPNYSLQQRVHQYVGQRKLSGKQRNLITLIITSTTNDNSCLEPIKCGLPCLELN